MGISLVKGQKISLEKGDGSSLTKIFLGAGWDASITLGLHPRQRSDGMGQSFQTAGRYRPAIC